MIEESLEKQVDMSVHRKMPSWLCGFVPRRGLANGHLQTIVGNYLPRPPFSLPVETVRVEVDPVDGSRVLCHCHWQPEPVRAARLTVVIVHGLEGSSYSRYVRGIAERAWQAGCNVVRMNMRNCCGTDALTPTLYHSGLSGDLAAVVEFFTARFGLARVALVGYSMGGNMVVKLAGEWGSRSPLVAVAAVCPAIDLGLGSDTLHCWSNRLYEKHFLKNLLRRYRRKASLFPERYATQVGPVRSIREFDNKIVARYWHFRDADDYYASAAAARVLDGVAVPTLILCAKDDPFIRFSAATRAKIAANPWIDFVETAHGGHCAYLGRGQGEEIHWAEAALMRYLLEVTGARDGE